MLYIAQKQAACEMLLTGSQSSHMIFNLSDSRLKTDKNQAKS